MKEITKELIDQVIDEACKKLLLDTKEQFIEVCKKIPEELKDNPMAYNTFAIVVAQGNAINVMREALYKLLTE